ncbi:response regulator transcription factor [Paenibacillus filicis]|uniref:Response regulator transcription factor n=1 Tax=Paenibacillus gyeongsangnamensis TaxID=3388067 RepID=A0ABT4QFR1_9BACL|nr:response regulator transcription factor [Paenibacillus filicis]MCZ8515586.1 response regulator transcription factor [Paenibacillus filicis]
MAELLIVDDESHVVQRLANLVPWASIGIGRVHTAQSAYEALELLAEHPVDIVLSDIRMPGMTGLELAERLQAAWPKTRCILLSGFAEFEYAKEAMVRGTADYLLKPVKDEELLAAVERVLQRLQAEWAQVLSQERALRMLRENLPQLRGTLLTELLQGRRYAREGLANRLRMLELPALLGEPFTLLLVRMEDPFPSYDAHSLALLEYAIANMAEELFAPQFELWPGRDAHGYLVFVMKAADSHGEGGEPEALRQLERMAAQLQQAIRTYLKGTVTILLSRWGTFPDELLPVYDSTLTALRQRIGSEPELLLTVHGEAEPLTCVPPIASLYELPTLAQLLEAGQWSALGERTARIFEELRCVGTESEEHLLEVFFTVSSAAAQLAHKNGRRLSELAGGGYEKLLQGTPYRSFQQLQEWTADLLGRLQRSSEEEAQDSRKRIIQQVHQFVEQHLAEDVSLQAIASHVYLHPVYVSKIYKLETGENLSDYVYRVRMDKAAQLLLNSQEKIYEIAARIGYQRAHSFIHVFKKHTGLTPQEYRDKHLSS